MPPAPQDDGGQADGAAARRSTETRHEGAAAGTTGARTERRSRLDRHRHACPECAMDDRHAHRGALGVAERPARSCEIGNEPRGEFAQRPFPFSLRQRRALHGRGGAFDDVRLGPVPARRTASVRRSPPGRRSAAGLRMQRFGDEAGKEADADRQEANAVGDSLHGKGIRQGGSLGHRDRSRCSPALAEAAIDPLPDHEFGRIMRSRRARTAGGPRRRPARRPPPPTGSTDIQ